MFDEMLLVYHCTSGQIFSWSGTRNFHGAAGGSVLFGRIAPRQHRGSTAAAVRSPKFQQFIRPSPGHPPLPAMDGTGDAAYVGQCDPDDPDELSNETIVAEIKCSQVGYL